MTTDAHDASRKEKEEQPRRDHPNPPCGGTDRSMQSGRTYVRRGISNGKVRACMRACVGCPSPAGSASTPNAARPPLPPPPETRGRACARPRASPRMHHDGCLPPPAAARPKRARARSPLIIIPMPPRLSSPPRVRKQGRSKVEDHRPAAARPVMFGRMVVAASPWSLLTRVVHHRPDSPPANYFAVRVPYE